MNFKKFENGIKILQQMQERENKINEFMKGICEDFIYTPCYDPFNYIFNTLWSWSKVEDAGDMLSYFIFELNYGKEWTKNHIKEADGRIIKLSNVEEMYNYLKGKTIYCEE